MMYQKYANAFPLYRQEQDWKQFGTVLPQSTLANWIIRCVVEYLIPVYRFLHQELLKRGFLMADEIRIQVLKKQNAILFEHERNCSDHKYSYEQRYGYRKRKEKTLLDAFWKWLEEQHPRKGSCFEKVVANALNRKDYLEDGRCSLTYNLSENAIRSFIVGRKNWLFDDMEKGAAASVVVYTMAEMARRMD